MKKYTLLAILMCFSLLTKAQTSSGKHHIKYLEINSGNPDMGVSFLSDNEIVFATTPTNKVINTEKYNPQMELYKGEIDESGAIINKEAIKTSSAKTSKSGATFSKDGKIVYFSENKYAKRKSKRVKHELFKAEVDDAGNWTNIEKVSFNKRQYSYQFPSINKEHTRLYFVSDAEPSFGGTDIFYVDIKEDGTFSEPVNLGEKINTNGNETTPFIAENNFLYFSSNGRDDSLGNMDVYASEVFENTISEPLHLSSPINSLNDDYGYIVNTENKGFFSSNRLQGRDNDDIYSFYIEPDVPEECLQEIVGTVRDMETEDLISDATINVLDEEGNVVETLKSDLTGNYRFTLSCRNTYTVTAAKTNYGKEEHVVNTANYYSAPPLEINQMLVKDIKEVSPEKVVINVNPIYFRFDRYDISTQAAVELDKIVRIMKENPTLIVESASHTDARGPKAYNQRLSERRAKATVDYIVSKGIERNRIKAKGYGETQLINSCKDGIRCSIDEHRLNRRTEFVIMNKEVLNLVPEYNNAPVIGKKEVITVAENRKEPENNVEAPVETIVDNSPVAGITFNEEPKASTYSNEDLGEVIEKTVQHEEPSTETEEVKETVIESNTVETIEPKSFQDEVNTTSIVKPDADNQKEITNDDINLDDITEKSIVEPVNFMSEKEEAVQERIEIEKQEAPAVQSQNVKNSATNLYQTTTNVAAPQKTSSYNYKKKIKAQADLDPEQLIKEIAPEVRTQKKKLMAEQQSNDVENQNNVEDIGITMPLAQTNSQLTEKAPIQERSDFSVLEQTQAEVEEKNIVLENESLSYNSFNRDFTDEEGNITTAKRKLFDESDDFDSFSGNGTNTERLASKVSREEPSKISFSEKLSEIKDQFAESTKGMDKNEVLSVNSIDVTPMHIRKNGKYITTTSANQVDVMRINFQISDNGYITAGYKEVYILIQRPDGTILNSKGNFKMNNGQELSYTEKTNAYYNNNHLNLSMMTDRFIQKTTKGIYTITIYIEGYPVGLEMIELS